MFLPLIVICILTIGEVHATQASIESNTLFSTTLHNNDINNVYKVIRLIKKQPKSQQVFLYKEAFDHCLQNNQTDLAVAFVKRIPSHIFTKVIFESTQLGEWLLKEAIFSQNVLLARALMKQLSFFNLYKITAKKDAYGFNLYDYAQKTNNAEIIKTVSLKNSFLVRCIVNVIKFIVVSHIIFYVGLYVCIPVMWESGALYHIFAPIPIIIGTYFLLKPFN